MATKSRSRKWFRGGRRKIPAAAIPKSIARVRKQRIVVFNTMQACEHTCVPNEGPSCTTHFQLALLRNEDLQNLFGDNVKIVSMRGEVYIDPLWVLPYGVDSNCVGGILGDPASWLAFFNTYARSIWQFRAGMLKVFSGSFEGPTTDPVPDYQVDNSFDWSEPSYMRRWEKLWFFKEGLELDHPMEGAFLYGYGNVTKPDTGALVNALAAGTGNINTQTGAITTAGTAVFRSTNTGHPQAGIRRISAPQPYRMSVNSRRVISLKENEGLEISCAFSTLFPGPDCFPTESDDCMLDCMGGLPCIIRIVPNILMTLQYG